MTNNLELRIEYAYQGFPMGGSGKVVIYNDGRVNLISGNSAKDAEMSPQRVEELSKKLTEEGFFELDERYTFPCFDGIHESVSLNYGGRSKTVRFENTSPPDLSPILRSFVSQSRSLLDRL